MKVVVLSGSPHKNGTTAKLVDSFIKGAKEAGHEVVRFDTAFMNVHPCIACNKCQETDGSACVFDDDMVKIGDELATSDCIVYATPVYYYGICAQLKTVIDRYYGIEKKIRRGQKTFFITAMSDDKKTEAINASYLAFVDWLEWNDAGILNAMECSIPEDLDKTDYVEQAYKMGLSI